MLQKIGIMFPFLISNRLGLKYAARTPAAGHFDHWSNGGVSGSYTVILDGTEYCQTDLDAAFSNFGQDAKVCVGDDSGSFACDDVGAGFVTWRDLAIGSLDGTYFTSAQEFTYNPDLVLAANNGNKNQLCRNQFPFGIYCEDISDDFENSEGVAIGLVDGDQYPDVVFANDGQTNRVCLNSSNGNGKFHLQCS